MDLGQLRSFAEVAERGTVAAAAAALAFTPPAISQHLAKLEAELGVTLFDRSGRRLSLTQAGHTLLPLAFEIIDLDYAARQAVMQRPVRPHFIVSGFASAITTLVIPLLEQMADHMTIDIIESEDTEALRDLRLGVVDLVLAQEYAGLPTERDPRLNFSALITDQLRLALPASMDSSTCLADLADVPWLMNGHGTRCTDATKRIVASAGITPSIAATVADNNTLLALVAAGHGVTIVPELLLVHREPEITVATQDLGISRTVFAVHRATTTRSVAPLLDQLSALAANS